MSTARDLPVRGRGFARTRSAIGPPVRPSLAADADNVSGPTWCDTREAAALLGCLPDEVTRLVEAGELIRHTRPHCFPHYSRREVLALAAKRKEAAE